MNTKKSYPILYEAYEHYQKTGDRHFNFLPKNPDYLAHVINTIPVLKESGYIEHITDNLLIDVTNGLSLIPPEPMSFDITFDGIRFVESNGKL